VTIVRCGITDCGTVSDARRECHPDYKRTGRRGMESATWRFPGSRHRTGQYFTPNRGDAPADDSEKGIEWTDIIHRRRH
jgi:hypothetical protein